ncbi:MAG: peptidoglycan-binding protein, partial [Roseibium sp.]|nr:peptidoglycan-binding protein [Roseibium sp.]
APQEPQFSNTSASVNLDATRTWILAETYLRQLGFDPGDLDGEADHDTLSAVAQFQEKFGLEITGDLPPQHLKIMQALALSSGVQSSDLGRVGVKTQSAAPPRANFSDYPATEGLVAPVAFPNFTGRDAAFRSYRTRIRNGVEGGVNFAGHYAFVVIGCGTNCRFGFVVDLRNGEVFDFPFGGEEHYQMDLQFQSDSRLVRVRWKDGWDKDTCSERDIVVTGTQFETLAARTDQAVDGLCYFSR